MKIVCMDSWKGKFTNQLKRHWEDLGHTVLMSPEWKEMEDADITFFQPMDNGIITASEENIPHKGKIYVMAIDIDVWCNYHAGVKWQYVDGLITIADHITEKLMREVTLPPNVKHKQIRMGVNLDEYSLIKPRTSKVVNLAYVVGEKRIWDVKRFDLALNLLVDVSKRRRDKEFILNVLGSYSSHSQYNDYCDHLIEDLQLDSKIVWQKERVESVNDWLEDKHILIMPSTKEAFSYATAEAMAKGLIPIINNFRGAKTIWEDLVCDTYGEMLDKLISFEFYWDPPKYRKFVEERFDEKRYFSEIDAFLGIK